MKALNDTVVQIEKYESERNTAIETAHDVKNFIGVLIGSIDLVIAGLSKSQRTKAKKPLELIDATTKEITEFLEQLMIGTERDSDSSYVDISKLSLALLRFCQFQERFKQIEFTLKVPSDYTPIAHCQEEQMRRVILNLLINAAEACLKADRATGARVDLSIEPDEANNSICIRVEDNGHGISKEDLDKVFRSRFTTKPNGHGIGLVFVSRAVTEQGGKISVESGNGRTAFQINLPLGTE